MSILWSRDSLLGLFSMPLEGIWVFRRFRFRNTIINGVNQVFEKHNYLKM